MLFYIYQSIIYKMGWFEKKEKKKEGISLPELPKLPELPSMGGRLNLENQHALPQLPSYPTSSFGEKFSQNAIKDAVSGEEVDDEEDFDADESMHNEILKMPKPLTREEPIVHKTMMGSPRNEPVFIRLDKFEEGLRIFEEAKHKIMELEKMLKNVKKVKEEEEKELQGWETEIQKLKSQFEKIDRDIFSKIY